MGRLSVPSASRHTPRHMEPLAMPHVSARTQHKQIWTAEKHFGCTKHMDVAHVMGLASPPLCTFRQHLKEEGLDVLFSLGKGVPQLMVALLNAITFSLPGIQHSCAHSSPHAQKQAGTWPRLDSKFSPGLHF